MPRVSEEYRRARRDEIAAAAVRCLERDGVARTTIADIVAESGLSAGAIYSHFTSKGELARYVATHVLAVRLDALEVESRHGTALTPRDVATRMLSVFAEEGLPPKVVLQFWAEATVDDEMRPVLMTTIGGLRSALVSVLSRWAAERADGEGAASRLAAEAATSVVAVAQGYIAHTALFGDREPDEYLDTVARVFA